MQPQIVAVRGPLAGRTFPLGAAPLSFGRTPENLIVLASPLASRRHAEVRPDGDGYLLVDLGSSNGTLLNGQRVQSQRLRPGDTFAIGDEEFRFEAAGAPAGVYQAPLPPPVQAPAPPPGAYQAPLPPQQPLPPLPQPAPGAYQAPPQPPRRGMSTGAVALLVVGVLGACVLLAGLIGGVIFATRSGIFGGGQPTAAADGPPGPQATPDAPAATPAAPAPTRPPVADGAAWTVLVYLDGDNNLEPDAITDFLEMAEVGSSDELKIVVQLDRISSSDSWDDSSAGNWEGTKRFLVERGMRPTESAALADLGEQNMGDPAVLADFIEWGVTSYPAQRYALILWDHGASWLGIASDDTDDGDSLTLPELSSALSTAQERTGFGKLDLIGFDACLMAQLDVFQAVEPYGLVAVASAELEPNDGWAWDAWLRALADDPQQDAFAIAPVIVETYIDYFDGSGIDDITLSAFDLGKIPALSDRVDALADAMIADMGGAYSAIGQARSFVDVYAPAYPEEFNAIDLGHFAQLLPEQGAAGPVAAAAEALAGALADARIANGAGAYYQNASGLSIYFPQLEDLYLDAYERGSPLPRQTDWDEFLKAYYGGGATLDRPTIRDLQLSETTVGVNQPTTLTGTVAGADIAYVFSFIGVANAQRDTVDLIDVDFVYPPGATPSGDVPSWPDGAFDLRLSWDATNWYLSNGEDSIEVLLGPVKYGTDTYGVEGVYTSRATGEEINAGLIFAVSQGQGTLERIWGFPRGTGGQEPQPYELKPAPGDTFTAFTRSYTDEGGALKPGRVRGQTITFGDQPLSAGFGSTTSGDYVMGFLVRDISGNFSYDFVDVTVDNSGAGAQPAPAAPAASSPGAQAGYLSYRNPGLGFTIEHPEAWEPFDTGREKIVFYDPQADDDVYFSVDIYSLGQPDADAANREILRQLIDLVQTTAEGAVRQEEQAFQAAGLDGRKVEYVYRNQDGALSYVVAIAVTSPSSGRTYLLTIEAPEPNFDAQLAIFNTMLGTLIIE